MLLSSKSLPDSLPDSASQQVFSSESHSASAIHALVASGHLLRHVAVPPGRAPPAFSLGCRSGARACLETASSLFSFPLTTIRIVLGLWVAGWTPWEGSLPILILNSSHLPIFPKLGFKELLTVLFAH
jgi:hypothetical protein